MADESIELAKNRAYPLLARLEAALAAGEIDEEDWYREVAAVITPAYLAEDTPWGQSGRSGDGEAGWEYARGLTADAIHQSGTFLDVGCASGLLMECVERWVRERGYTVEPHGLDIAPELADLARRPWRSCLAVPTGRTASTSATRSAGSRRSGSTSSAPVSSTCRSAGSGT